MSLGGASPAPAGSTAQPADSPRAASGHPLRNPRFVAYWLAGIVSSIGSWLQNVTAGVVVYQLTGSPSMVGVLAFATFAPVFVLALPGGYLADRFGPRVVVVGTHIAAFAISLALTILAFAGHAGVGVLIGVAALLGTCQALSKPALSSLVPALVPRRLLARATAINTFQFTLGQIVGSLLSAVLLASAGASWAFAVNCVSFLVPIAAMAVLGRVGRTADERRTELRRARGGAFRLVRETPPMLSVLVTVVLANAAVEGVRTLAPVFVSGALALAADQAGLIIAGFSVGSLLGLIVFGPAHTRFGGFTLLLTAFGVTALGATLVATAGVLAVAMAGAGLMGVGFAFSVPVLNSTLMLLAPEMYRGRVMSLFAMAHLGVRPVFSLVAGGLTALVGPRWAIGGLAVLTAGTMVGIVRLRAVTGERPAPRGGPTPPPSGRIGTGLRR